MEELYEKYLCAICLKYDIGFSNSKILRILADKRYFTGKKTIFIQTQERLEIAEKLNIKLSRFNKILKELCDKNILNRMDGLKSTYNLIIDFYSYEEFCNCKEEIAVVFKEKREDV